MPYKDPQKQKEYWNAWYAKNKSAREKQRADVAERKRNIKSWYKEYKKTLACERCGKKGIACLDFHHKDESNKEFSIHRAVGIGYSKERILKEIEKCTVLCANCHVEEHNKMKYVPNPNVKYKDRAIRRAKRYEFLDVYKEAMGCDFCHTTNPLHLEFHHIWQDEKKSRISSMVSDGYCLDTIFQEVRKCAVVCRNCHRELHASE